ncbi:MAG: hypothetical protein HYZ89_03190 [Candidatus Omnitrophica bacterium]|nr:hypothetical protein [Candidatus Omnitrophota bacterium]
MKPFTNKIDLTQLTTDYQRFPIYRPGMEVDVMNAVINRFQFTGLLRPAAPANADSRLEGELVEFRRDALRFNASQQVEEWRLSVVVNLRFYDLHTNTVLWEEAPLIGDATYFALGANAESEAKALDRAIKDLARRVVERAVESCVAQLATAHLSPRYGVGSSSRTPRSWVRELWGQLRNRSNVRCVMCNVKAVPRFFYFTLHITHSTLHNSDMRVSSLDGPTRHLPLHGS